MAGTRLIKAVITGFIFIFSALLITAGIFYSFSLSENYIPAVLGFLVYFTSFIIGISASKGSNEKGYQNGLISGIIFGALYFFISMFLNSTNIMTLIVKLVIIMIISTFGGIVGINLKNKKR